MSLGRCPAGSESTGYLFSPGDPEICGHGGFRKAGLSERFAWKWCRQPPEAHAAMKEKRSLRAHVASSILASLCLVCFLACGTLCWAAGSSAILNHKKLKIFERDVRNLALIHYVEAWGHLLLHLGCLERSWGDFAHPV